MPDKVLTASPEDPEPVVTPKPTLFKQFDGPWAKMLMRPSMIVENGSPRDRTAEEQLKLADKEYRGDLWSASGCHPTSTAMVVEWFRRHPRLGADLELPYPPDANEVSETDPRFIWKWLYDPQSKPALPYSATSHPAFTPRHRAGAKDTAWSVDHGEVTAAPKRIKRAGVALALAAKSWKQRLNNQAADLPARADRKKTLKQALHKCGPIPINMTYPGHFVLLYGYRGDYLYILDPGQVIEKWAFTHPDWPKVPKKIYDAKGNVIRTDMVPKGSAGFKLVDSKTSRVVAQFFSSGCDLRIDGEFEFQEIALGKDKAKNVIRGPMAFLDGVINYEGYYFPKAALFDEFLAAPAPGSDGAVITPLPPPPAGGGSGGAAPPGSAAPPPVGGATSTSGTTGGGTPAGNAGTAGGAPPPSGGFFSDLWDILLHPIDALGGAAGGTTGGNGQTAPGTTGSTSPVGTAKPASQVRGVVTVIDDDTEKPLSGVEVEVVGIDKGKTDAKGAWASRAFDTGTYNIKTRKPGFGPGGSDHVTSEGETAQSVAFESNQSLTVRMRNVNLARGFVWVLEERSRRRLSGIEAEIVGIDAGPTEVKGKWVSKSFAPGKKWVKTRAAGWGPAGSGAIKEGETAQQVDFGKGDKTLVVYMSRSKLPTIPAPDAFREPIRLKVSGPREIDAASFTKTEQSVTFKADPSPAGLHPLSNWTVYGPSGNAVDTNVEPLGSTYDLSSSLIKGSVGKLGNEAYGLWTVRFERGSYYDDCNFMLVGPMPDVGATAAAPPPAAPAATAPANDVPAGFVADGFNPNVMTQVNSVDMAHAYADALKMSGATPTRRTVLILTAHWHFETGGGKSMHCFNAGNIKYSDKSGKVAYTMFRCDEWVSQAGLTELEKAPSEQYEITDKTRTVNGKLLTRVFVNPPHPWTRFRAYPNLAAGVLSYLNLVRGKKFEKAYQAALTGSIEDFAHQLKVAGYYTDFEDVYKKGLQARYKLVDGKVTDLDLP